MSKYLIVDSTDAYDINITLCDDEKEMIEKAECGSFGDVVIYEIVRKVRRPSYSWMTEDERNKR